MDSKKTMFFVLLVLILYFASIQLVLKIVQKHGQKPMMTSAIATLTFTVLLLALLHLFARGDNRDGYKLLEISPAKKCIGGPYMWGDVDSPTFKYCSDPKNQQDIRDASCCLGFVGMPVKYTYTPESDAQWQNPRCHIYGSGHIDGVGS
jgi:hypothetical protein